MVVPVKDNNQPIKKMEKKELVGNRKEFRIGKNLNRLRIIGNGNKIVVQVNEGVLEIIGNMIRVKILNNKGKINFIGNNSKIYIGKDSPSTKVQCSGNDIKFKLVPKEQILTKLPKQSDNTKSTTDNSNKDTESSDNIDMGFMQIKNNISLPNLEIIGSVDLNNCLRVATSSINVALKS